MNIVPKTAKRVHGVTGYVTIMPKGGKPYNVYTKIVRGNVADAKYDAEVLMAMIKEGNKI